MIGDGNTYLIQCSIEKIAHYLLFVCYNPHYFYISELSEDAPLVTNNLELQEALVEDGGETWTIEVVYPGTDTDVSQIFSGKDSLISSQNVEIINSDIVSSEHLSASDPIAIEVMPKTASKERSSKQCSDFLTPYGYECPKCKKIYNARKNLVRHVNVECGKEPQFVCPYCDYKNHRRNEIKKHVRVRHSVLML